MTDNSDLLLSKSVKYFLQLTEDMNYTQAAQSLGITQPALTQQIKKMENAIGTPLFGISGKKLFLTEAGKRMKSTAEKLRSIVDNVTKELEVYTRPEQGNLTIGVLSGINTKIISTFLSTFLKKYPQIRLNVVSEDDIYQMYRDLDHNKLDFIFNYLPHDLSNVQINFQRYQSDVFTKEKPIVLIDKDSQLSLNEHKLWAGYSSNYLYNHILKNNRNKPSLVYMTSNLYDLLALAKQNDYAVIIGSETFKLLPDYLQKEFKVSETYDDVELRVALTYTKSSLAIPRSKNFIKEWVKFLDNEPYSSRLEDSSK
ncbi:MAG: LysR family transcriptional regulator [Lactobacillus sp.]|nr:LysR family transcriptional regulator [Lactobacillus sp.]